MLYAAAMNLKRSIGAAPSEGFNGDPEGIRTPVRIFVPLPGDANRCSQPADKESKRRQPLTLHGLTDEAQARFWSHVAIPDDGVGCWFWTKGLNDAGYGVFRYGSLTDGSRRQERAHRIAYLLTFGEWDPDRELDHLCFNRNCANPWHLEVVTHAINLYRTRRSTCRKGHPLTRRSSGNADCLTCNREALKIRRMQGIGPCTEQPCDRGAFCKGLCQKHYERLYRGPRNSAVAS